MIKVLILSILLFSCQTMQLAPPLSIYPEYPTTPALRNPELMCLEDIKALRRFYWEYDQFIEKMDFIKESYYKGYKAP